MLKLIRDKVKGTAGHMLKKFMREANPYENSQQLVAVAGGGGKTWGEGRKMSFECEES